MSSNLPSQALLPMSTIFHHESTRVPITALAFCGCFLVAGEGPFLRIFNTKDPGLISSTRIFKAQAVHGISVHAEEDDHVFRLVVWGGRLVRALEFTIAKAQKDHTFNISLSNVVKASDWILDLACRPFNVKDDFESQKSTFVAVTAHNALLQLTINWRGTNEGADSRLITNSISELTSSSRSILYSAHLLWESSKRLLVAAGTAFGEIMYWSWNDEPDNAPTSRMHSLFLGHEGSIFGVQISQELRPEHCHELRRVIASCSDDRTIRIWDASDANEQDTISENQEHALGSSRTTHTGFSNEAFDPHSSATSQCLAIGWGHLSRVWTIRFLNSPSSGESLSLLSTGEDTTARAWQLISNVTDKTVCPYQLSPLGYAGYHNGKNIWSCAIQTHVSGSYEVFCGGADSKITAHSLVLASGNASIKTCNDFSQYTMQDILLLTQPFPGNNTEVLNNRKSKADFFRSYCFVDSTTFLITANSGKVLVGSLLSSFENSLSNMSLIAQLEDLHGYSMCASSPIPGVAFLASGKGTIYIYQKSNKTLKKIHSLNGKVGEMLATKPSAPSGQYRVGLLINVVGLKGARLLHVEVEAEPEVSFVQTIPISDWMTGSIISSMAYARASTSSYIILGFRRGSIALYSSRRDNQGDEQVAMFRIIENAHGDETVTCLEWYPFSPDSSSGHLLSVGRDGKLVIHFVILAKNNVQLFHQLPLPLGPNIEGLYFHEQRLFVHGFSSKKWVLYDVTLEEEVMNVETGGAHRSWVFQPHSISEGGTLVWTRAADLHICTQAESNHTVLRSGGHGREIKAVAVSPFARNKSSGCCIATGAEDTDIKIFQYHQEDLICRTTIRKHTTGIQHLQWSADGHYLFSSGGCEEFYIWRIREMPPFLGTGVVCEHAYFPESEYADLRIMSFDVMRRSDGAYIIAMVFSDSSLKIYEYAPEAAIRWRPLAKGIYSNSCLTQCMFLSPDQILTAGTDGHAVVWPFQYEMHNPTADVSRKKKALSWDQSTNIHQNSSKVAASHSRGATRLVVSGGDDGSLAFLLVKTNSSQFLSSPVLLQRAHASAVTACTVVEQSHRLFVITSGNDEWVRLWEVVIDEGVKEASNGGSGFVEDGLEIRRYQKIKTNVADVSCMAVLGVEEDGLHARVLLCGVGMEVIRVECGQ